MKKIIVVALMINLNLLTMDSFQKETKPSIYQTLITSVVKPKKKTARRILHTVIRTAVRLIEIHNQYMRL